MNVYTHDTNPEQLKPVMVWIHGGGFAFGSGNGETDFYGPSYFLDRDIVLVTINYRLNVFGFLSTGDAEAPGNYGLLDQTMALKWVQGHIHSFGGDPDSVTIFGESAGGASVEYHVLSPHSIGLFHRAISQSGSSMSLWASTPAIHSKIFAEHFNCSAESSSEILDCLRSKDENELVAAASIMTDGYKPFVRFVPRVDAERESPFLPAKPKQLIRTKSFNQVPYITGLNRNEGSLFMAYLLGGDGAMMKQFQKNPIMYLKHSLTMEKDENGQEKAEKILELFDMEKAFDQQLETIEQVFSDMYFFKSIDEAANLFGKFNEKPTYYYHYAFEGVSIFNQVMEIPAEVDLGVAHGNELNLMFSNPFISNFTEDDIKMRKVLIDLWTSFAIQGTPESDLDFQWLPNGEEEKHILNIDLNPSMVEKLPFQKRLPFWNQLLDGSEEVEEENLLESLVNAWDHYIYSNFF